MDWILAGAGLPRQTEGTDFVSPFSSTLPHLSNILQRRRAEDPAVFAAELRGAFVADPVAGRGGVELLDQH